MTRLFKKLIDVRALEPRIADFSDDGQAIYAVMLTGRTIARIPLAINAIRSFLRQSYENRILLIINDGDFEFEFSGLSENRIVQVRVPTPSVVGALRNYALSLLPHSAVWVQWDDDDWHHEKLIEEQYKLLENNAWDACTLASQIKYALHDNAAWEHRLPAGCFGFAGTPMARCSLKVRYPAIQRSEDSALWAETIQKYRVGVAHLSAHYYIRFIHGSNSSLHLASLKNSPDSWNIPSDADSYMTDILPLYDISKNVIHRRILHHDGPVINL